MLLGRDQLLRGDQLSELRGLREGLRGQQKEWEGRVGGLQEQLAQQTARTHTAEGLLEGLRAQELAQRERDKERDARRDAERDAGEGS